MDCRPSRTKDPDEWVETCPEISRPICEALRERIQRWEPDLRESIKWNMLCFSERKHVCAIGGYQRKAELTVFRGGDLEDPAGLFNRGLTNAAIRGIALKSVDELESLDERALRRLLRTAVELDLEPELPAPPKVKRPPPEAPKFFAKALDENPPAKAGFDGLAPTYQREYIVWVSYAKRPETRERRLAETLAALAAGKKWAQRRESGA